MQPTPLVGGTADNPAMNAATAKELMVSSTYFHKSIQQLLSRLITSVEYHSALYAQGSISKPLKHLQSTLVL